MERLTSRSRDGQLFTTDLVISSAIFLLMVNIALLTWNVAYQNKTFMTEERGMRNDVVRATDLLVRTEGYPSNWTDETVEIAGFSNRDHLIDNQKLKEFHQMDYASQREAVRATENDFSIEITVDGEPVTVPVVVTGAGLGEEPVAYIMESQQSMNDVELLHALNGSTLDWELYWPSNNDEAQLDSLTASHVYNYTTDGPAMFEDMVANLSGDTYETVIAEDANVGMGDIGNENDLNTFVEDGGTYLHTGDQGTFVRDLFGLNEVSIQGDGNGTVVKTHPLLNSSLAVGDFIEFENEPMAFTDVTTMFVNDTDYGPPPTRCLACRWNISHGNLYYLADTRSEADNPNWSIAFQNATDAFRGNLTATFGVAPPADADTVAVNERSVLVNTIGTDQYRRGRIKVMLWR